MGNSLRRALLALAAIGVALSLALAAGAASGGKGGGLSKEDRAAASAPGASTVTLLIAAKAGASKDVAAAIASIGGSVKYAESSIDYIRADVPADKADALAKFAGVEAAEVDKVVPLDDPSPEAADTEVAAPGPTTPGENAYMPTRDIGAPQFVAANPTYDGRGVVIGILDTGVDLLTPELQSAKALDGTPARKIVDWVTATDPLTDGDPTWLDMEAQVSASGGTFAYGGTTYTAPAATGSYRIATFSESSLAGSEYGGDLNRDGDTTDSFAVLWDPTANTVWVDTDGDNSFADQAAMTDFKVNHDQGTFGTDNPATALRESVPFVVQIDGKHKYVNLGIVSGAHGTHVAGIAAGKGFFGGAYNGAAPEAQVISARACLFVSGCTAHALIEGMVYLAKKANVDVINMSIGGLPALNDGNNARAILYNRLIDQTKAQMFISAGNSGPGINTVGDPSVATKVMSVGAYVTKETWLSNYGASAAKNEQLFVFSSRGPREDGGFKPNIVAPGSAVSSVPAWEPPSSISGGCLAYTCPPGYAMFNGTSMAAPQATGGAALLISASKQAGAQYKPDQLREAINSSARFISTAAAHEQGNGLFNVGAAWNLLKTTSGLKTVDISSSAPVSTVLSGELATPGAGEGIYLREGVKAGDTRNATISFTRTSGAGGATTYNLSWLGNDGTFSSAGSISLAKGATTALAVTVHPAATGVHSAILRLDDPSTPGIEYQVMNTVVAASQFGAANNYTVTQTGSADRPDKTTFFYSVPANTPALKVDLTGVSGRIRGTFFHPYGVPVGTLVASGYQTGGTQSRTLSNPFPGVWEVTVDTSRTSTVTPATFTITASLLGVDISPASWTIDPAAIGTTDTKDFTFTNRFGSFTGKGAGTALGSAVVLRPTIASTDAPQIRTITVPAGSTQLTVKIGNPSDSGSDLDLYVYYCSPGCVLKGQSAGGTSDELVTITSPAAGTWKTLVDPYAIPSGSTAYDYSDVIANSTYGTVAVADVDALHPNGDTWTRTASVTATGSPGSGRFLQGFVQARSGSVVLGSAEVDLKNVTP